jgi:DNA-binding NarL/FixJ family response regulator
MRHGCRDSEDQTKYFTFDVEGRQTILIEGTLSDGATANLTAAERAVAILAAEGRSDREIAEERGRSVRTVARQLSAVYHKLRIGSRTELAGVLATPLEDPEERE